ncbi:ABC transporter ATP-binding protein [Clostridium sp. DL1XJH146]
MTAILEIKELSKSFLKDNNKINVLNKVDISINKGEFVSIVGPSGCGKSTLLGLIAGFDKYDEGTLMLKGEKIVKASPNRIMVFQDFNQLFPWKTLLQNVLFPLNRNKKELEKSQRIDLAKDYLRKVKLEEYENYYPHEISGGMKQRASIARALVMKPEILLMDEPFGSLDVQTRYELHSILLDLWKEIHSTIIFVTHDIEEAILISDRIIIMGESPNSIKNIVVNDLKRPRDKLSTEFTAKAREIYFEIKQ